MVHIAPQNGPYRKPLTILPQNRRRTADSKKAFRQATGGKSSLSVFYFEKNFCQDFLLFELHKYAVLGAKWAYPFFTSAPQAVPEKRL